jgi:hypothetical protein
MANAKPPDGLNEFLAEIYVILKRHEQMFHELVADVEALKANLPETDRKRLEQAKAKARSAASEELEILSHVYDGMIQLLRGK